MNGDTRCAARMAAMLLAVVSGCDPSDATNASDTPTAQAASRQATTERQDDACGNGTLGARIVWDVQNTFEQERLRAAGAPAQARGLTRREVLIRGDAILNRQTGKTWIKDPDKYDAWKDEYDEINDQNLSSLERLTAGLAWKERGKQIPEIVVRLDWTEFKNPGSTSYRYGLVPGSNRGERWIETPLPVVSDEQAEAIFTSPAGAMFGKAAKGWTIRPANFGGVDCELYTKTANAKTHEFCVIRIGRHNVYLYNSDQSADGEVTETVTEVDLAACITDDQLRPPGRIRFEDLGD